MFSNNNHNGNNNKRSNNYIKRSFISDSREEEREEFEKFVQEIKEGENMSFAIVKREMEEMREEN